METCSLASILDSEEGQLPALGEYQVLTLDEDHPVACITLGNCELPELLAARKPKGLCTAEKLKTVLGETAVDIQHVGSTAIKTIAAKPIIDLAVGVRDFDAILKHENELKDNGFFLRSSSIENQLLFACGSYYDGTGDLQTHFIHVVI